MRIAVVEPYLGGSHAGWAEGYQQHSGHEVVLIAHTDRFWKWRMHGSQVTLARELEAAVDAGGPVDVVLGSSMLNGAAFLGLARHVIGAAKFAVFMHENQLGYPLSPRDRVDHAYPMINWTSTLAADLVVFNSEYHRSQWFAMLPGFLRQFPDYQQHSFIDEVQRRSIVLPVGVDLRRLDRPQPRGSGPARILWNQRWEYDKGTAELARALTRLGERGADFELVLAGEQFPTDPAEFVQLRERMGNRLIHYGWADPDRYVDLLVSSDVVVSTAHHEFFGVAVTEAIYAGAFPVLPNRLVYPERIPAEFHDLCLYDGEDDLVDKVEWATKHRTQASTVAGEIKPAMATADWSIVAPRYDSVLESC